VLFDVDGTLVDSNYLHTVAWSRALRDGGEWAPMNAIHRLIGMGGDQLVTRLIDREDDAFGDLWEAHYEALLPEVAPFPGAADLLRDLRRAGLRVVLASSSPAAFVSHMVKLLGVEDELDGMTSADDATASKPSPDIFRSGLEAGSVDRARALVVGDSIWDVQAARAAGLGAIGVETGGFSRHELWEEGAIAVYRDVRELLDQWRTGPIGQLA